MSPVAHHLLLTITLKALQTCDIATNNVDYLSSLKSYIQSLLSSQFMLIAALAKAAVHLLQCSKVTKIIMELTLTDSEVDQITTMLNRFTQDKLTRRYYSHTILQVLCLLNSQPANITQFTKRGIAANLQSLMELSKETEAALIANILQKVVDDEDSEQDIIVHSKVIQGKTNLYTHEIVNLIACIKY